MELSRILLKTSAANVWDFAVNLWHSSRFPAESQQVPQVSGGKMAGFRWKTSRKPVCFQRKAHLRKFLLELPWNSGGFHQAKSNLNPGNFPMELQWNPTGILVEFIPLETQWESFCDSGGISPRIPPFFSLG